MLLFIARISYVLFIDFAQEEGHFFSSVSFTIMALLVLKEKTQKRALFLFCSLIFPAVFTFFSFFGSRLFSPCLFCVENLVRPMENMCLYSSSYWKTNEKARGIPIICKYSRTLHPTLLSLSVYCI